MGVHAEIVWTTVVLLPDVDDRMAEFVSGGGQMVRFIVVPAIKRAHLRTSAPFASDGVMTLQPPSENLHTAPVMMRSLREFPTKTSRFRLSDEDCCWCVGEPTSI